MNTKYIFIFASMLFGLLSCNEVRDKNVTSKATKEIEYLSNKEWSFLDSIHSNKLVCDTSFIRDGFTIKIRTENLGVAGVIHGEVYFNRIYTFKSKVYFENLEFEMNELNKLLEHGGECLDQYSITFPIQRDECNYIIKNLKEITSNSCSEYITIYIKRPVSLSVPPPPISASY